MEFAILSIRMEPEFNDSFHNKFVRYFFDRTISFQKGLILVYL